MKKKFYILKGWMYHIYLPLDLKNNVVFISFYNDKNTILNFNLNIKISFNSFYVNYTKYYDFKKIIDKKDFFNKFYYFFWKLKFK